MRAFTGETHQRLGRADGLDLGARVGEPCSDEAAQGPIVLLAHRVTGHRRRSSARAGSHGRRFAWAPVPVGAGSRGRRLTAATCGTRRAAMSATTTGHGGPPFLGGLERSQRLNRRRPASATPEQDGPTRVSNALDDPSRVHGALARGCGPR